MRSDYSGHEKAPSGLAYAHEGVQEALSSGRIGFTEISPEALEEVFGNASAKKEFVVPDDRRVTLYSDLAIKSGRGDLVFTVGPTQ